MTNRVRQNAGRNAEENLRIDMWWETHRISTAETAAYMSHFKSSDMPSPLIHQEARKLFHIWIQISIIVYYLLELLQITKQISRQLQR